MQHLLKYSLIKYLLVLTTLFSITSYAALEVKSTRGSEGSIPIAILPFAGQAPTQIAQIVSNDLKNSGRFKIISADSGEAPSTAEQVDFSHWQKKNVDNIVVGNIKPAGGGAYRV